MDKNNIINDKKKHPVIVHHIREILTNIHNDYGLGICHSLNKHRTVNKLIKPRCFEFYCISHFLDGECRYWTEKAGSVKLNKGQGIMTVPGFIHFYGGVKHDYIEDSVCFTGKLADSLFQNKIIENGIVKIGNSRRLLPIIEWSSDPTKKSQIKANIALQQLIFDLHTENQIDNNSENYSKVSRLKEEILKRPESWWTVNDMAEFCNLGKMQFHRVFKTETGISPKQYIDNLKMQKAVKDLADTNYSVMKIAEILGYRDSFHFSRRFKRIIGASPTDYRKKFQQK